MTDVRSFGSIMVHQRSQADESMMDSWVPLMYHGSLILIQISPNKRMLDIVHIREQVYIHTFFKPSYCNPVKVHKLGSLLSPQVRLTAANTLKIDILFRSFPV